MLNDVKDIVRESGKPFEQVAPEFYKEWQKANEIHGALQASNYIGKVVSKLSTPIAHDATRALFGAALHGAGSVAAAIPPLYLINKGTQVLHRISRSPQLMKYYTGVLTNSLRGNIASAADMLNKLDTALEKEDKRHPIFKD
jgi:hypothetical protein